MKTIKEWFQLLPQAIRDKASYNYITQSGVDMYEASTKDSLKDAINSFTWIDTPEGVDYWIAIKESCNGDVYNQGITMSSSFIKMLRSIENSSDVARLLLTPMYTTTTDFADYITMRSDMGSYLPHGREHKTNDSGKWSRDGRQEMKIGKLARKILRQSYIDSLTDADFEKFTNCVKSYISLIGDDDGDGKKLELRLIEGDDIYDAYDADNYSHILGRDSNLWGSCMRHEECRDWLSIYADNTDVCQLLIAEDTEKKILGRAIVWKLDDGRVAMDTIYSPESIKESFFAYAIKEGWYYKSSQSCHHHDFDKFDGKEIGFSNYKRPFVSLKNHEYDEYPYMDSLYFLSSDGRLSNEQFKGDKFLILRDTGGGFEDGGQVECEWTGRQVDEDETTYLDYTRPNGQRFCGIVCDDELVHVDGVGHVLSVDAVEEYSSGNWYLSNDENICHVPSRDEYRFIDDCTFSEFMRQYILTDEMVITGDDKIIHQDEAENCCIDGKMYDNDDMMTEVIDGMVYRFYEGNKEQFFEQFKLESNETRVN
jgi:hypothetical protein